MTLPTTGSISASQINTELGRAARTQVDMNGSSERTLAGKTTARSQVSLSNFRGKSAAPTSYLNQAVNNAYFTYSGTDIQYGISLNDYFSFVIGNDGSFTKPQSDQLPTSWISGGANISKASYYRITTSPPNVSINSTGEYAYSPISTSITAGGTSTSPTLTVNANVTSPPGYSRAHVIWTVTIENINNASDKITFTVDMDISAESQ